jgi:hypothetical protein
MKRYGPSRRRAQNASAALRIFVRHPKRTFATVSSATPKGLLQQYRGYNESAVQVGTLPTLTHLYGPAVRCKPEVNKWRGLVLRICIRPLHGAFVLLPIGGRRVPNGRHRERRFPDRDRSFHLDWNDLKESRALGSAQPMRSFSFP